MTRRILISVAALLLLTSLAFAQQGNSDPSAAIQTLTGGSSRTWVLHQVIAHMGSEGCTKGETYTFKTDHSLVENKCQIGSDKVGTLVATAHHWSLQVKSALDLAVVIDGKSYLLLVPPGSAPKRIRLQDRSASKTDPTFDMEFHLSED